MTQAVILAGGRGTRLRDRIGDLPKPLVSIGGEPLLGRQLSLLERHGFTEALLLVGHGAEQIEAFCSERPASTLRLSCVRDGEPRGTAGAVLAVADRLADRFLVMYADTMLEVDLRRFSRWHERSAADVSLFLHPNDHPYDSDLVAIDDGHRITAFHPKPHAPDVDRRNLVSAALYWMEKAALTRWSGLPVPLDFGKDLFPRMVDSGACLMGYVSPEYIKDAGTPDRLDRVRHHFATGVIARASLQHPQKIVFLDRDGTMNVERDHLAHRDELELLPGVIEAVHRLNVSEYRCCVVTNQPVVARGDVSFEGLRAIHDRLETLLGRGRAFIDGIYVCPHHPDRGFPGEISELKTICDCRKPAPGLIEQALVEFNGDRDASWFIGDSTVDIEAAHRAGIRSILLQTGHAGLDGRCWSEPDHVMPDLPAAIDFILEGYDVVRRVAAEHAESVAAGDVVLIGGRSRSGKSTFAHCLRDELLARGRSVVLLAADRWLLDEAARSPGVLGRYDMNELRRLATACTLPDGRPLSLALAAYDRKRRRSVPAVESLSISAEDVVIIEGTVALSLADAAKGPIHALFVECDEGLRRERVLREYRARGESLARAEEIYLQRQRDEIPVIDGTMQDAAMINLESAHT